MKKIKFYLLATFVVGCKSLSVVNFDEPVDTSNRKITILPRKVFFIDRLNISLSNDFKGSRLNNAEYLNDSTAVITIKPENEPVNNSGYYSFKIWSKKQKDIYLLFKYPKKYTHRYVPKVKRNNRWNTLKSKNIINTDKQSFTIKLNVNSKPLLVSAQEIFTSNDTYKWIDKIIQGKTDFINYDIVGKSVQGRKLPVLDIYKGSKVNKPIIVLLTRQHPPEVTGFFAFQEFLKTIVNNSKLSNDFLEKYRVLAFPILNPDGVDLGHWRHNANGVDLNRDWSKYNQIEVKNVVNFIHKVSKRDNGKILLGLDFHSTWRDVFYTNKERENTTMPNFIDDWFKMLEKNISNYKVNEASGNSKKPVSKGWFLKAKKAVGITYEIGDETPRERIKEIGKATAEDMMKLLCSYNSSDLKN